MMHAVTSGCGNCGASMLGSSTGATGGGWS